MKRILALILTTSVLFTLIGCAAGNSNGSEAAGNPGTDNNAAAPNAPDSTGTVPDGSGEVPAESGDDASMEPEQSPNRTLTSDELKEWENYFNKMENNGLLRFPYENLDEDPDQLAPYLGWLFYDIGDHESSFSEGELALLNEAGLWLELDAFRLRRDFMNSYLSDHFSIPAEKTENLLDAANIGIYLLEYDAWYIAHGDTEYNPYTMDRGTVLEDGTVRLYYFNDFLRVVQDNGEMDYVDAEMIITLVPREDGSFYITSHEINASPYQD